MANKVRAVIIVALLVTAGIAVSQLVAGSIPAQDNAAAQAKFLFNAKSNIVVLDVAVTDNSGNPINDL